MTNFFTKALLLLLVTVAAAAHNPRGPGGLRADKKKKLPNPTRSLEKHEKIKPKHRPGPARRHLEQSLELCQDATDLQLGNTVEATFTGPEGTWFTVAGTGGILAVSTCTGDAALDESLVDTVISVYSGGCDVLNYEAYDDDFGSCGNLRSTAGFATVAGETYNVNVAPFFFDSETPALPFGITLIELDELPEVPVIPPFPEDACLAATPLELDQTVEGEISEYGATWYTFVGTGNDLVISTCTGNSQLDNSAFDSVIEVYARGCDDLRWIGSDDEGGKCGNGKSAMALASVQGLTYQVAVYEYLGMSGPFGLKVSASA